MSFLHRVATAPISWGICEVPGWGQQMEPGRVLSEMRELGFPATELGSDGFLPADATELRQLLASFDLRLLGGFVPLVLHVPGEADETLGRAERLAKLFADADAWHFITAAVTSWDWGPRRELTESEWRHAAEMLDRVGAIAAAHGLTQVLHPHVDTIVETAAEVEEVLRRSDVMWCFDTGHLFIGGVDPVDFAMQHFDRIGLVHLKDVVANVVPPLNDGTLTLKAAVQAGIFSNLGDGDARLRDVIAALEGRGYSHWYVVEQDTAIAGAMPAPGEGPIDDVRRSYDFLRAVEASMITAGSNLD